MSNRKTFAIIILTLISSNQNNEQDGNSYIIDKI